MLNANITQLECGEEAQTPGAVFKALAGSGALLGPRKGSKLAVVEAPLAGQMRTPGLPAPTRHRRVHCYDALSSSEWDEVALEASLCKGRHEVIAIIASPDFRANE